MKNLLALLLSFLILGIGDDTASGGGADPVDAGGGDEGGGGEGGSEGASDGGEGDDGGDDAGDGGGDGGGGQQQQARRSRVDHEAEARTAREDAARARAEAEELRRRMPQPQTEDQRLHEAEEAKLRNPNTPALEKWQIESNRTIRTTRQEAQAARFQALDLNDKTDFNLKCSDNKRLASVKADVEAEVARMRSRGQNAPRESVAYYILGQKVANAKTPAPKPNQNLQQQRDRGTAVRSDARSKPGAMTSHQKLTQRLENVQI